MNKKTILLIGLAAAGIFLMTRGGGLFRTRRRGIVEVESPEAITEDEFNNPGDPIIPVDAERGGSILDTGRDILDRVRNLTAPDPERRAARQQRRTTRQQARTVRRTESRAKRKARQDERRRKQAERRAARQQRRNKRRNKVGDIPVFF